MVVASCTGAGVLFASGTGIVQKINITKKKEDVFIILSTSTTHTSSKRVETRAQLSAPTGQ